MIETVSSIPVDKEKREHLDTIVELLDRLQEFLEDAPTCKYESTGQENDYEIQDGAQQDYSYWLASEFKMRLTKARNPVEAEKLFRLCYEYKPENTQ